MIAVVFYMKKKRKIIMQYPFSRNSYHRFSVFLSFYKDCKASGGDKCCDFKTCTLQSGAKCADGMCCENCQVSPFF